MRKKKYQVKKVGGIKVVSRIEKDANRSGWNRTAVYESKKNYSRSRAKDELRREMML